MIKANNHRKALVIALFLAIILSGCNSTRQSRIPTKPVPAKTPAGKTTTPTNIKQELAQQNEIKKFSDYSEMKDFLEANAGTGGYYGGMMATDMARPMTKMTTPSMGMGAPTIAESSLGIGGGSQDYSTTNIQVEGVDEADIVKTDGEYIYSVSQNDLYITKAYPADQAKVVTKIAFKNTPQDIYINGNRLIVYGSESQIGIQPLFDRMPPIRRYNYTFFTVFDISDKNKPVKIKNLSFEGNYTNSRMIGDYVYFVTTKYSYGFLDDEMPLPIIIDDGKILSNDKKVAGCNCPDVYYFSMPYQSYNFTSVTAINVVDTKQPINNEAYLLNDAQNMYVSQNNIYITYTKYVNEQTLVLEATLDLMLPLLSLKDQQKIAAIQAVDKTILNADEKMGKIMQILYKLQNKLSEKELADLQAKITAKVKEKYADISKELEKTVIHKIAINKGELKYQTEGEVTGQVLNQFSMDESDDYFRIATTKNRTWSAYMDQEDTKSYNNLYVLDKDLKTVGQIEKLATDERIFSVRFMQNRAYLVTFKQTDPLFVIDLKDPKNPKVLGELKVPGFSNYLHPYNENILIGLGKETAESEWGGITTKGVKLSLFDVSDVTKPKEIDKYIVNDQYSDSIALNDHKAFLFSKDKNLLVIPVTKQKKSVSKPTCVGCITPDILPMPDNSFRGALVFHVDEKGFKLKGEIEHPDSTATDMRYWYGYNYYDNSIKRSLYISDLLYTVSGKYIKINKLDDLKEVESLKLEKNKGDNSDFEIIN